MYIAGDLKYQLICIRLSAPITSAIITMSIALPACPVCREPEELVEWAVPANDNHLLLADLSPRDLGPGGDTPERLIWKRRHDVFTLVLLKNADKARPILNRVFECTDCGLHLRPNHLAGYYVYGESTRAILSSICDSLVWTSAKRISSNGYGVDVSTTDDRPPVYRFTSEIRNNMFYKTGHELAGCVILHVRYAHSDVRLMPPAIEGVVLDFRLARKDFTKLDSTRIRYSSQASEHLDCRSVLDTEWEMLEAYKLHALPGSSYFVNEHAFETHFAPALKYLYTSYLTGGVTKEFESRNPVAVSGLVGFVAAPYCVAYASLKPVPKGSVSLDKSIVIVTFVVACVKCSQMFYDPKELIPHLNSCFDVDLNAELHSENTEWRYCKPCFARTCLSTAEEQ